MRLFIIIGCMAGLVPFAALAQGESTTSLYPPKLSYTDAEGWKYRVNFRSQTDAVWINDDNADHSDGIKQRRLWAGLSVNPTPDTQFLFRGEFANDHFQLKDAVLTHRWWHVAGSGVKTSIGHFKEPFGMEQLESNTATLFAERADADGLVPKRNSGAQLKYYTPLTSATIGAFTQSAERTSSETDYAITGRATYAPFVSDHDHHRVHLGVSASYRRMNTYRVRAKAETAITHLQSVDTGRIQDPDNVALFSGEFGYQYENMLLQGEWLHSYVDRLSADDVSFHGWYLQSSWVLTGETRPYDTSKNANFSGVKPDHPFDLKAGEWGAWELAARFSVLDLNDGAIAGGIERSATAGVNWYPDPHWRVTGNLSQVWTDAEATTPQDDPFIAALRIQFQF